MENKIKIKGGNKMFGIMVFIALIILCGGSITGSNDKWGE
jgi:hypothetical protein